MFPFGNFRILGLGGQGSTVVVDLFRDAPETWGHDYIGDYGRNNYASTATIQADDARAIGYSTSGRYWFCEILPKSDGTENNGDANRITLNGTNSARKTTLGNRYIDTILPALQAANDGSANDLADVANGLVPRSLQVDGVFHLTDLGNYVKNQAITATIETYGP